MNLTNAERVELVRRAKSRTGRAEWGQAGGLAYDDCSGMGQARFETATAGTLYGLQ